MSDREKPVGRTAVLGAVALRAVAVFPALGALFFGTAGTFAYWNAWLLLALMGGLMLAAAGWMLARDPELLAKRLRTRENRGPQKGYVLAVVVIVLVAFSLPGLDFRFGWSRMPTWLVAVGSAAVIAGFLLNFVALVHNRFASRVIELQTGQHVVDSGPYRVVRHPMYAATVLIYLGVPLVLGSWASLGAFVLSFALLPVRILNEERMLREGLPGYEDYMAKVRWRILPLIW